MITTINEFKNMCINEAQGLTSLHMSRRGYVEKLKDAKKNKDIKLIKSLENRIDNLDVKINKMENPPDLSSSTDEIDEVLAEMEKLEDSKKPEDIKKYKKLYNKLYQLELEREQ